MFILNEQAPQPVQISLTISKPGVQSSYVLAIDAVNAEIYHEEIAAHLCRVIDQHLQSLDAMLTPPAHESDTAQ